MNFEPQGYLLRSNQDGYFVNPFIYQDINREIKELLHQAVYLLRKDNQEQIDSVYVRGSFASNTQIPNYSDIDLIVIHTGALDNIPKNMYWDNHMFRLDIDFLPLHDFQDLRQRFGTHFMLKTQSIHLYGENRIPEVSEFSASTYTASQFGRNLPKLIDKAHILLHENNHHRTEVTKWIARALLRATNALFLDREQMYTRDLVLCYRYFSKYYPYDEPQMRQLLEQAIHPTFSEEELITFLDSFGLHIAKLIEHYHQ